ncbi:MAG: hypothetical protein ACQSGP_09315 [Frankia sp.]
MIRTLMTRRLAAAATGGVLAVGGGALAANTFISPAGAASVTASTSPAASASAAPTKTAAAKHPRLAVARRVVHGEFTAKTKTGYQVFDAQRGTVTAVSPSSITIKSPDGFTATYTVTSATKVHRGRTKVAIASVTVNAKAVVLAKPSGSTPTATQIVVPAK